MWRVTSGSLHIAALSSKSDASGGLRVRRAVVRVGGIIDVLFGFARRAYTGLAMFARAALELDLQDLIS
jgi:hypothetical protein